MYKQINKLNNALIRNIRNSSFASSSNFNEILFTDEEKEFQSVVQKFAETQVKPCVKLMEKNGKLERNLINQYFNNGFMGINVPTKYGGLGCKFTNIAIALEEIAKVDASAVPILQVQNVLVNTTITKAASEEHKSNYLPQLVNDKIGCFALTESSSGSDAFSLKTIAKADSDDFIINGSKMFITNSDIADIFLIMANANPAIGYKGITCFIIERDTKGLSVNKPEKKLGLLASGTCGLTLDNVRVHKSQILGEIGGGYLYAIKYLTEGRIGVAAQMLGIAQGCFNATLPYLLERKQFGQAIFEFQGIQHQVSRIAMKIEAARLLTYQAARLVDQQIEFTKEACMAKVFACNVAQEATISCIDWMGGNGFMAEYPQEKYYRDVKAGSIYEGTTNVQLNTIAKCIKKQWSN